MMNSPMPELDLPRALPRRDGVMLGVFLPNQRNIHFAAAHSGQTPPTYEAVRNVTTMADELGMSFALTVAHWRGRPGSTVSFADVGLETISLTGALLEATSSIVVFTTVHSEVFNPAVVANMGANFDQLSGGRWGMNVVAGWNEYEFRAMGLPSRDHADRYAHAEDWLAVIRELWTTGRSSHRSRFYELGDAECFPRPRQVGGPVTVNAGQSPTGMKFATENCDFLFSTGAAEHMRRQAEHLDRETTGFIGRKKIVLAETRSRAEELANAIVHAADKAMIGQFPGQGWSGLDAAGLERYLADPVNLRNAVLDSDAIVGGPAEVARELADWIVEARVDGVCLTFFDMERGLELCDSSLLEGLGAELAARGTELLLEERAPSTAVR